MNPDFFLSQTAQFDKSINMLCLVFLALVFLFAVFFLQLTQYVSIVFIQYIREHFQDFRFLLSSHCILLTHYLLKQIRHVIYEPIKALEIKTSIVSTLGFASNTISLCFFLIFLIFDLYILISAVIAQIFIPTTELAIPTGTPTNEVNAEIETQPLTAEMKIRKRSQ